jgi:hypothetical protein
MRRPPKPKALGEASSIAVTSLLGDLEDVATQSDDPYPVSKSSSQALIESISERQDLQRVTVRPLWRP